MSVKSDKKTNLSSAYLAVLRALIRNPSVELKKGHPQKCDEAVRLSLLKRRFMELCKRPPSNSDKSIRERPSTELLKANRENLNAVRPRNSGKSARGTTKKRMSAELL